MKREIRKFKEEIYIKDFFSILNFDISEAIEVISSQDMTTGALIYKEKNLGSSISFRSTCQYFKGHSLDEAILGAGNLWLLDLKENNTYRKNVHFTNIGRKTAQLKNFPQMKTLFHNLE